MKRHYQCGLKVSLLEDGTEIKAEDATAWVAGASASAAFNQSLTFVEYEGAVDVFAPPDS